MTALSSLSRRETILIAVMAFLALPLALWALVAVPLQEERDRAIAARAAAQADYVWVTGQAQEFAARTQPAPVDRSAPVGLAGLEVALIDAELRAAVSTLEATSQGGIRLQMRGVPFETYGRFLDLVAQTMGYNIAAFQITPTQAPGLIDGNLELIPARP